MHVKTLANDAGVEIHLDNVVVKLTSTEARQLSVLLGGVGAEQGKQLVQAYTPWSQSRHPSAAEMRAAVPVQKSYPEHIRQWEDNGRHSALPWPTSTG